jgi:hypothetical protein
MKLLFFLADAADPDGAPVKYRTPLAVPTNEEKRFKVPAGIWKLAREDVLGDRFGMMSDLGSVEWPPVHVAKDGKYLLLIRTDEGNNNVWVTDLPIIR